MKRNLETCISFFSLIVASGSFFASFWFANEARERDFLYKSYDRFGRIFTIQSEFKQEMVQWSDKLEDGYSLDDQKKAIFYIAPRAKKTIDRMLQEIHIHQFAMSNEEYEKIKELAKDVQDHYDNWEKAIHRKQPSGENFLAYFKALYLFLDHVRYTVNSSMANIAEQIRP